jgi:hypothetical protein
VAGTPGGVQSCVHIGRHGIAGEADQVVALQVRGQLADGGGRLAGGAGEFHGFALLAGGDQQQRQPEGCQHAQDGRGRLRLHAV